MGQLGIGQRRGPLRPQRIAFRNISEAFDEMRLAQEEKSEDIAYTSHVFGEPIIVSISAGSNHSVALTSSGKIYSWGHSEYGQHGNILDANPHEETYENRTERYNCLNASRYYVPQVLKSKWIVLNYIDYFKILKRKEKRLLFTFNSPSPISPNHRYSTHLNMST